MHSHAVLLHASPGDGLRRHGRPGRWAWRSLAFLAGLVASVALVVVVVRHVFDEPWLKRHVQSFAHSSTGLDIDYSAARLDLLSGAEVDALVVRSPAEVRPFAPDLLRVGRVKASWSLRSLLGRGPAIQRLAISDVALTVVVDASGRTSLDALAQVCDKTRLCAPAPLSHQTSGLAAAPPVGRVEVDDVTAALVRTQAGRVSERMELRGVGLTLSAEPVAKEGWRVTAGLGSRKAPLDLSLTRVRAGAPAGAARARLWLAADATSSALAAALDVRMLEQTLATNFTAYPSLHAEANLRFDPTAGRTEIAVHDTQAGGGIATAEASIEVLDTGSTIVRLARGDVDLARLLPWLPPGLVPVTVERARLRYQIDSLSVGPVLRLAEGGSLTLDADLSKLGIRLQGGALEIGAATASLRAQPAKSAGIAGGGTIQLARTRLDSGGSALRADDLSVDFDGQQATDGAVTGRAGARFTRVALEGKSRAVARGGHVELHVQNMHPDPARPLATRGDLSLSLDVSSVDAHPPAARVVADGVALGAHTLLDGHAPYAVKVETAISRLQVQGRDGVLLADAPARVRWSLGDVVFDRTHPAASRAVAHAMVDLGKVEASLDAVKDRDAVDFSLRAATPSLKDVRPLIAPALAKDVPWDEIAVAVRSTGRVDHLGSAAPSLREATEVDVERPAFGKLSARSLSVRLRSKGTALRHEADVDLRARALTIDGQAAGDDHVTLSGALDRVHPSVRLRLDSEGRIATELSASASFEPSRRAVPYEIDAHVSGLDALGPLLARVRALEGFDLSQVDLSFSSRGTVVGLVTSVGPDGTPRLEPRFARTAGVEGQADVRASYLRWTRGVDALAVRALAWHGDLRVAGTRRTVDSHLDVDALHLGLGPDEADFSGLRDDSSVAVSGDLSDPMAELVQRATIRAVRQTLVPEYAIGDVTFAVSAEREPNGLVHVADLKLTNGAGGTSLGLAGNIELGPGRRTLSMTTALEQDIARLSLAPDRFRGRGAFSMAASVASPDLALFRVRAALKGRDVFVTVPQVGVEVEGANGEVPVKVELRLDHGRIALKHEKMRSPYSVLRFADQHPLRRRGGAFSIVRLRSPSLTIAPLVGNLELEQGTLSLRQFEMGVRGGTVTGQGDLDLDGPRSTLDLHVRATGVQSSHGEPLDGNVAVVIAAADRSVQGRAEIFRIGERQVLDLLDMQDPTHADPAINSIRTALHFGHVDRMRVTFDHGFASAHLELGGFARFFRISDVRGIPMGPLVDKVLVPALGAEGRL